MGTAADDRPILALTLGDAAGIGPELVMAALGSADVASAARLLVVGDGRLLSARAKRVGAEVDLPRMSAAEFRSSDAAAAWLDVSEADVDESIIGVIDANAGSASVKWVRTAAELARDGTVDAMVTAPINKQSIKRGGCKHEGHTELLGEIVRAKPVMMLIGGGLRVAIVTRHCALRDVPRLLNKAEVIRTVEVVNESLRCDFGLALPRIAVLALNPHASDGGRFGSEEKEILDPAVKHLQRSGISADGPLVPDVAFWHVLKGSHDAVVAMYHDQGLIPLKTLAFDKGVNVTLGLPIVRTSPGHGTAFEIAGSGTADPGSFLEAVRTAVAMVRNRKASAQ